MRSFHHPLIAFIDDVKLVSDIWLRRENISSVNNFLAILEDTLFKLKNKTVGLIQLDSSFFQADILDYLEQKNMDYVIAAKFTHPIQRVIHDSTN